MEVIPKENISQQATNIILIPARPEELEEIFDAIRMCNPQLPTHNWKIAKTKERHGARCATIIVQRCGGIRVQIHIPASLQER